MWFVPPTTLHSANGSSYFCIKSPNRENARPTAGRRQHSTPAPPPSAREVKSKNTLLAGRKGLRAHSPGEQSSSCLQQFLSKTF